MRSDASALLTPQPYRVVDVVHELADTVTVYLSPIDQPLPSFRPAQASMVGAFGVGEAALSISHATPDAHGYTIRRAGAITNALADTPVGGVITVRGPFGRPWPVDGVTTPNLLVLAGGLGIAPLRALVDTVANDTERFERVVLVYGAKDPDEIMYSADLERWRRSGVEVHLTVDHANGDPSWRGSVGVVPDLLGENSVELDWSQTTAMMCGPDAMMHFTAERLLDLGVRAGCIWLSLERNMQCGNALCGHCQLGPFIVCRDGPVASYAEVGRFHQVAQL